MNPAELNLNPIDQISLAVIVAVALIVVATYFVLRRVFVAPYLRVLDERQRMLESSDVQRLDAANCLAEASAGGERAIAEAAQQAETMRADARAQAEERRRADLAEATSAAAGRLEEGRAAIAAERAVELARVRSEAIECVDLACSRLLGAVDEGAVAATVDRLIARQAE